MTQRTCSAEQCGQPHLARGLCRRHYKLAHERFDVTCRGCGEDFRSSRKNGKFCSDECKGDAYRRRTYTRLPRSHPGMVLMREMDRQLKRAAVRECVCEWCGTTISTTRTAQRFCSMRCKAGAKRMRRRAAEHGAVGTYTWTEVMKLFIRFGRCCAYCRQPVNGQPEPDHVVPLSRGGSNSITNILPSCPLCNADKRDLLLGEWATDRARRKLPPVVTTWAESDAQYRHLTVLAPR